MYTSNHHQKTLSLPQHSVMTLTILMSAEHSMTSPFTFLLQNITPDKSCLKGGSQTSSTTAPGISTLNRMIARPILVCTEHNMPPFFFYHHHGLYKTNCQGLQPTLFIPCTWHAHHVATPGTCGEASATKRFPPFPERPCHEGADSSSKKPCCSNDCIP